MRFIGKAMIGLAAFAALLLAAQGPVPAPTGEEGRSGGHAGSKRSRRRPSRLIPRISKSA